MGSRRILVLVASMAVGAIATLLMFGYVNGVKSKSDRDSRAVTVLVARGVIEAGTPAELAVSNNQITRASRRRADLPADYVTRSEDVKGQLAAINLQPGEVITQSKFVTERDATVSRAGNIDPGNVAVAVPADLVHGVAGIVQPGDLVNIMVPPSANSDSAPGESGGGSVAVNQNLVTLYQNVKVLSIGQNMGSAVQARRADGTPATSTPEQTAALNVIVFQVPPEAATVIGAFTDSGSTVYLTLNRRDNVPVTIPVVTGEQLTPGVNGGTPYPEGAEAGGQK